MGYKGKTDKEYQREYYYKNREQRLLYYYKNREQYLSNMCQYNKNNMEILKEYQRKYYLRNREQISNIRAEYYIDKIRERNKNKNNVVIVSNKIVISIIED
jgi:hypothetical protein